MIRSHLCAPLYYLFYVRHICIVSKFHSVFQYYSHYLHHLLANSSADIKLMLIALNYHGRIPLDLSVVFNQMSSALILIKA